ncbi:replication factor-a protein [Atractiella rhizophila]|nr:replication factor-a protein [Atractiella rhizophila]
MYHDLQDHPGFKEPVIQVLNIRKIAKSADPSAKGSMAVDRYRLLISDGQNLAQAMLATQANPILEESGMDKCSIIRVLEFSSNPLKPGSKAKKLIIVLNMEVLHAGGPGSEKIGDPVQIEDSQVPGKSVAGVSKNEDAMEVEEEKPTVHEEEDVKPKLQDKKPAIKKAGGNSVNARGGTGQAIFPIEGLSPYQNKWMIKARVTQKGDVRRYNNQRGDGKVFSMILMDNSGEIKATAFGDVVDTFYNKMDEGKVYLISNARVGIAKKAFNNTNNEYEMTFERHTVVEPCEDDDVPQMKFDFTTLGDLEEKPKDALIDVIGILKECQPITTIITKATQKEMKKRELTLVDRSGFQVRVTLWGRQAESFPENVAEENPIIAFKSVRVGDFGGRSLSFGGGSSMSIDPDVVEAHSLRGWYDRDGRTASYKTFTSTFGGGSAQPANFNDLSKLLFCNQVKEEAEAAGEDNTNNVYNVRAMVNYIRLDNLSYPACPSDNCNKKMDLEDENKWRCEKCEKFYPKAQYRYILSFTVQDSFDNLWLRCFNDAAEMIIGMSADQLNAIKEEDEGQFKKVLQNCCGKYWFFQLKSKIDTYKDNVRVNYTVSKLLAPDFESTAEGLTQEHETGWDDDVEMN